jgi:hypothetical protein
LWFLPIGGALWIVLHVVEQPAPTPVPSPNDSETFGLAESKRKEIFGDIAEWNNRWRRWAKHDFPNSKWSREDHYHNLLRMHVEKLVDRHDLNYSIIYLIYDEGVRKRWPAPDGEPLRPTTVPLDPPPP